MGDSIPGGLTGNVGTSQAGALFTQYVARAAIISTILAGHITNGIAHGAKQRGRLWPFWFKHRQFEFETRICIRVRQTGGAYIAPLILVYSEVGFNLRWLQ